MKMKGVCGVCVLLLLLLLSEKIVLCSCLCYAGQWLWRKLRAELTVIFPFIGQLAPKFFFSFFHPIPIHYPKLSLGHAPIVVPLEPSSL
jgi:hypothetical protein